MKSGKDLAKKLERNPAEKEKPLRFPKTDVRYWQKSVFKLTYTSNGTKLETREWSVRIQHLGRREVFSLDTANKLAAAEMAREIYLTVKGAGWELAISRYKNTPNQSEHFQARSESVDECKLTVGEYIEKAKAVSSASPSSINTYCQALRMIVAQIFDIKGGNKKYDHRCGGRGEWLAKIDAIPLSALNSERITQWKLGFLKRAGNEPAALKSARCSVNSILRCAKSLFSRKTLSVIDSNLQSPFDGVDFEPRQSMRYRSRFEFAEIVQAAQSGDKDKELEPLPLELWKMFLLAAMAGLRRNEIDKLEWKSFRWGDNTIRIEETEYFTPKTDESAGDVQVDAELMELFRAYQKNSNGPFVIESRVKPKKGGVNRHYRCQRHFKELLKWLKKAGVPGQNTLHTLRKEYGSQMCDKHGIYAASRALRHTDIHITSMHYLDIKGRKTLGMGSLLTSQAA